MAQSNKELFKWTEPDFVAKAASEELKKGCWQKLFKMEVLVLFLLAVVYYLLRRLQVEPEYYIDKFYYGSLFAVGYPLLAFIIFPFLSGHSNRKICIKENGIIVQLLNGAKLYKWSDISYFKIIDTDEFPGSRALELGIKSFTRKYHLTQDIDEKQLLTTLATYVDHDREYQPISDIKFSSIQKLFIAILTLIFIVALSYMMIYHGQKKDPLSNYALASLYLTMFLGPGTFSVILLKGPKALKTKTGYLTFAAINMLTLMLTALILVLSQLIKYTP